MSAASSPPRRGWRATVAPLRHRDFALVWAAGMVSNVGTWMETVAVGDLVTRRTGQAGWTAFVAAAGFIPMGVLGPVGGALADRVDRRRMLLAMTAAQMACAAVIAGLAATGRATPGAVTLVVFVAGCIAGVGFPAYSAMLPDLVPKDDLLAAMSLSQAQWNLGRVIGPALAGIAIGLGSYTAAFAVNTASFAAMLLALQALREPAGRDLLERAVLQQPREQQIPRLEQGHGLGVHELALRQEARDLHVEQRGRDHQELRRLVQLLAGRELAQIRDELVRHLRQRDLGDVQLALRDQVQQQVEGSVEVGQRDAEAGAVSGGRGLVRGSGRGPGLRRRRHARPAPAPGAGRPGPPDARARTG